MAAVAVSRRMYNKYAPCYVVVRPDDVTHSLHVYRQDAERAATNIPGSTIEVHAPSLHARISELKRELAILEAMLRGDTMVVG